MPDQLRLLEVIYQGRGLASSETELRWPIFQYVEHELYRRHGIDAMHVLGECPTVGGPWSGGQYGWTWSQTRQPGDEIGLTVAGMAQIPASSREVSLFVAVLRLLVDAQRLFEPSPTDVRTIAVTSHGIRDRLPPSWVSTVALADIPGLLRHEPATWHCTARPSDDSWELELSPFLRRYAGIGTAQEYLGRLVEVLTPAIPEPPPLYPSPLSLPEAIDYLNAIWRLHAGKPLIRIGRAEAAAKLVLDCTTVDEFESRLSAVCSILDGVDIPDRSDSKLVDLSGYLQTKLTEESAARALAAVDDLRALFDLRVWRQHAGTEDRAARGMSRLGISLPVYEWGAAWQHIQARAIAALSALREEVETLVPTA
ncbi:MAG TPA: hypothetical protein VME22_02690 [Solirubrobacteraceae bacterium]|nr:hypothetical protein [Solirubrobacteraceae bacterium]